MNYFYHKEDPDNRKPACYLLTYRGCSYWSCYKIHLLEWFENILKNEKED